MQLAVPRPGAESASFDWNFSTLLVAVRGRLATNSMQRGNMYFGITPLSQS